MECEIHYRGDMGNKIIIGILIGVSFILLNIFSRFLYNQSWYSNSSLAKELNPFEIISLVVTTVVTIWLGWYVSKKITEQRYEKEYVITDLKKIEEEIEFIERNLQFPNIEIQTLLDHLNKLKICIDRFSKTAEIFQISCVNNVELENIYRKLYTKTTNLEGNILTNDNPVRNEITQVCNEIILKTRSMIFKINKH